MPCVSLILLSAPATHALLTCVALQVALKAVPYKADLFAKLRADPAGGPGATQEELDATLAKWLAALASIVARMEAFYEKGGHAKGF